MSFPLFTCKESKFIQAVTLSYGSDSVGNNNTFLRQNWDALYQISDGTLDTEYDDLYFNGGAFYPAYDTRRKTGVFPPSATVLPNVRVLLSAYRSIIHKNRVKLAVISIWANSDGLGVARILSVNLRQLSQPLTDGTDDTVWAITELPEPELPVVTQYHNAQDFRSGHLGLLVGKHGNLRSVGQDPDQTLAAFHRRYVNVRFHRIISGLDELPGWQRFLPSLVQRQVLKGQAQEQYPDIDS